MCTFLDITPCQMIWNKIGLPAITRFLKIKKYSESKPNDDSLEYLKRALKKYFASKPNDDSQERMERQPLGLLQAQLQSMGLVEPLGGETFRILELLEGPKYI